MTSKMSKIRLITFDVHKTLIKVCGSPGEQYSKIAEKHGVTKSAAELDEIFTQVWNTHWDRHPNFGAEDNSISSRDWWTQVVSQVFLKCGYKGQFSQLNSIAQDAYDSFNSADAWSVFPDVHETLTSLRDMNVKLGVISNFDKRLNTILDNLDLAKYFNFVTTSEVSRACKPNPRIFEVALNKSAYKFPLAECLHVGNSVKRDYLPAVSLGLNAAIIFRGDMNNVPAKFDEVDRKFLLPTLSSVPALLESL